MKEVIKGGYHTVLEVELAKEERLDRHYATSDAVIVLLKGKAHLNFSDKQVVLNEESAYLIPGLKAHTLEALENVKAFLILGPIGAIRMTQLGIEKPEDSTPYVKK